MASATTTFIKPLFLCSSFILLSGCASFLNGNQLVLNKKADSAYSSGNVDLSLKYYNELAESSPDDPLVWKRLGNLYALSKKPEMAIHAYETAIKLSPRDSTLFFNLAILRLRQADAELIHAYQSLPPHSPYKKSIVKLLAKLKFLSRSGN